jgi:hypothetical protein
LLHRPSALLEAQEYVNNAEQTSYYEMSYVVGLEDGIPKLLGGEIVTEKK